MFQDSRCFKMFQDSRHTSLELEDVRREESRVFEDSHRDGKTQKGVSVLSRCSERIPRSIAHKTLEEGAVQTFPILL